MYAGIAWHPDPAQSSESIQLVTASADKTARFFSGEGKQLGTLQVSKLYPLNTVIITGSGASSCACTCAHKYGSSCAYTCAHKQLLGECDSNALFAMPEFLLCRAYELFLADTSSQAAEVDVVIFNFTGADQVCSSTGMHELQTCINESKQG